MHVLAFIVSLLMILLVLVDCFESILQPRRVTRRYRYARVYYQAVWAFWRWMARHSCSGRRRSAVLSAFGPLSLLGIFASWVALLVVGFGLLHWSLGTPLHTTDPPVRLGSYLYLSGTTFFTLGYGDVTPAGALGRTLAVAESGLGFGFLGAILSYLPALFQAYSRRELTVALLDARAGSPPTGAELLLRFARANQLPAMDLFLADWERWSAELLESQLSFPVLAYYRSQHDNQSWLAALTALLDACALLLSQVKREPTYPAQVAFAIARHAAVDLALVLRAPATPPASDRLPDDRLEPLRQQLAEAGLDLWDEPAAVDKLSKLRGMYEPFVQALADRLLLALPPLFALESAPDNWQRSAWMRPAPGIGSLTTVTGDENHFV